MAFAWPFVSITLFCTVLGGVLWGGHEGTWEAVAKGAVAGLALGMMVGAYAGVQGVSGA